MSTTTTTTTTAPIVDLTRLYDALVLAHPDPADHEALWGEWLWGCDCNAPPTERCFDLNEMHGLGLLLCLYERAFAVPEYYDQPVELPNGPEVVHLFPDRPVSTLSIRETLDQLECMQLHWGPVLQLHHDSGAVEPKQVLRALMARLGEIAHHAYPLGIMTTLNNDDNVLDDPQHITQLPLSAGSAMVAAVEAYGIVSRKSLRQATCLLLAMLRVHAIVTSAVPAPEPLPGFRGPILRALRVHHLEASQDLFDTLQQMVYLAPGQRLAYRTLFAGMYNSVSQVVYFHHPRFSRQPQFADLARIPSSPLHMLPLVTQLLPEIEIYYDDDSHIPVLTTTTTTTDHKKWAWLVACGAFFLIDVERGQVLAPPPDCEQPLVPLIAHYLRHNPHISIAGSAAPGQEEEPISSSSGPAVDAAASHVCFA